MNRIKKNWKKLGIGIILLAGLIMALTLFIDSRTYSPMEEATVLLEDDRVSQQDDWLIIQPQEEAIANLVLYQGAFVEVESYLPLAVTLSDQGIRVFLPYMPLNLAILNPNIFQEIHDSYASELPWWIGGHSLGGTSSLMYAADNGELIEGAVLLASYPSESTDLSQANLTILSIHATRDKVIDKEQYENTKSLLPDQTTYVSIEEGNHSQFAYYGLQEGDAKSDISREEQHGQVVDAILNLLDD